jgi:hypothetical protein
MALTRVPAAATTPTYTSQMLTSGTTFTVPTGVSSVDVLLIGGGQGGQGCSTTAVVGNGKSASGGGGGAIMYLRNYPVTAGGTVTYSIGSGGSGGANPAPTANSEGNGGTGGNTTFGSLVCPGGNSRVGSSVGYARSDVQVRGVFDVSGWSDNFSNQTVNSSRFFDLAGAPLTFDIFIHGSWASSSTLAQPFTFPYMSTHATTTYNPIQSLHGISNTFNKIVSSFTGTTGSACSIKELVSNTSLPGWGGFGAGSSRESAGSVQKPNFHGGGEGGALISSSATGSRGSNGGAAAANSGAGGGAGTAYTNAASVQGASGGAGGSGVIFVGYWI